MRFILGLGFGALTTLSSALLLDWHGRDRVLEPVVDPQPITQIIQPGATRAPVPVPPRHRADEPVDLVADAHLMATKSEADAEADAKSEATTKFETGTGTGVQKNTADAASQTVATENTTVPSEIPAIAAQEPPGPAPAQAQEPVAPRDESAPVQQAGAGGRHAVWRPFHSQLSAKGFARRLSLQLGYPFEVIKADAAEYLVVFAYEDEAQRDLLSAQVTELTGFTPR